MKKIYEAPEMIAIALEENDILTLSGKNSGDLNSWVWNEDI